MFTAEQIKDAHRKVRSGADFPAYIQELKKLGVRYYEMFVADGQTEYYGANEYRTASPAKYTILVIAEIPDEAQFKTDLKAHQEGQTDYLSFCACTAKSGIEKWAICMEEMTCTYYGKAGKKILVEKIPQ